VLQNAHNTVHHTLSILLHYLWKLEVQIWWKLHCALKTRFIIFALTRWNLNWFSQYSFTTQATLNTFSSVKKMKSAANWKNFFRNSLRAAQFVSGARRLLKDFSCRSFRMMRTTDDIACLPWYFTDCAVSSGLVLLTQKHIVHLVNVFIRAGTWRSAAALTSVMHCARVSELLQQHVNATCRPSFVRKLSPQQYRLASYSFTWYIFH